MQTTTIDHQALRQRFNPDGSQLRKHQLRMLEILVVIDKICRKHQIPYWLSSGTLIGAVRHNGFIPWDDDLDIEMMRNDYLHLLEVLTKELPDWLALQTDETDPNYFFFYAKVRDRRSLLNEGNNYDRMWKEKGIYIDIFPMEEHPIWLHKLTELSVGHMYKVWRKSKDDAKAIKRVRRIFNFNNRYVFPFLRRFLPSHDSSTQSPPPYGGLGVAPHSTLHTPHSSQAAWAFPTTIRALPKTSSHWPSMCLKGISSLCHMIMITICGASMATTHSCLTLMLSIRMSII